MKKILGIALLLVVTMVFIGCPQPGGTTDPVNPTKVNAVEPVFKSELSEDMQTYAHGETTPLTATASVTDGGTISYQWYSNDEANTETPIKLDGETKATFEPPTATSGIFYYYAVATNTIEDNNDCGIKTASITSKVATIAVSNAESDFFFTESTGEIRGYSGTSNVVIIPSTINGVAVKIIGNYAFGGKDTITSLRMPNSVTVIDQVAFQDCSSLVSIHLSSGLESIKDNAFYNCTSLESVNLPSGLKTIGMEAFRGCKIESITIPGSVTSIGSFAFTSSHLTSVVILEGVTRIGQSAFDRCSSLTSVSLPTSLENIGVYAFQNCLYLESITIPENVEIISNEAFLYCRELKSVTVLAPTPPTVYSETFRYNSVDFKIYVPADSVTAYTTAWTDYSDDIQAIP